MAMRKKTIIGLSGFLMGSLMMFNVVAPAAEISAPQDISTNSLNMVEINAVRTNDKEKKIPAHMPAGTVIEYGENSEMKIINPGLTDGYDESKQDTSMDSKLFLPMIQPGLRVAYDGMGLPALIKLNGTPIGPEVNNKDITNNKINSVSAKGSYKASGIITWYDDVIGQADHTLGDKDCATKLGVDNVPVKTIIYVTKTSGGIKDTLTKWDAGTLDNAVLDIRLNEMKDVFKVKAGYKNGVSYGSFDGSYYHN